MKTFDIETETTPVEKFAFAGRQAARAAELGAVRVFRSRDIRGDVRGLPHYMLDAIKLAGYVPRYLGGTRGSHSVIGLVPAPASVLGWMSKITPTQS